MTMQHHTPDDKAEARLHARVAAAIEAWLNEGGWPGTPWPMMTSWPVTSRCRPRRAEATFTDDLRGLSRAGQIARVQAVARQYGDRLTETEADEALSLYAAEMADGWPGDTSRAVGAPTGKRGPDGAPDTSGTGPGPAARPGHRGRRGLGRRG
jgi:hypothetical protein